MPIITVSEFVKKHRYLPRFTSVPYSLHKIDLGAARKTSKIGATTVSKLGSWVEEYLSVLLGLSTGPLSRLLASGEILNSGEKEHRFVGNLPNLLKTATDLNSLFPGLRRKKNSCHRDYTTAKETGTMKGAYDFFNEHCIVEIKYSNYRISRRSHYSQKKILQAFCYSGISGKPVYLVNVKLGEIVLVQFEKNEYLCFSKDDIISPST